LRGFSSIAEPPLQLNGVEAMSENLELVRTIYANWERGDFGSADWADPAIEYTDADGPLGGARGELAEIGQGVRHFLSEWEDFRLMLDSVQELDAESVLALDRRAGRSRASGLELEEMRTTGARVFRIRNGKVRKIVVYFDRDRAIADLRIGT
jgi:ketosteroid isomerase-like protein